MLPIGSSADAQQFHISSSLIQIVTTIPSSQKKDHLYLKTKRLSVPEFGTKVSHLVTLEDIRPEADWSVARRSLTERSKKSTSIKRGAFVPTSLANPNPSNPRHGLSTCIDHSITTENTPQVPKLNPLTLFSLLSFTLDRVRHNAEQDQGEKARHNTHTHRVLYSKDNNDHGIGIQNTCNLYGCPTRRYFYRNCQPKISKKKNRTVAAHRLSRPQNSDHKQK